MLWVIIFIIYFMCFIKGCQIVCSACSSDQKKICPFIDVLYSLIFNKLSKSGMKHKIGIGIKMWYCKSRYQKSLKKLFLIQKELKKVV